MEDLRLIEGEIVQAAADDEALMALATTTPGAHVAGLTSRTVGAPLVAAAVGAGGMSVNRYAGALRLGDRRIDIRPRMGWRRLAGWVEAATDVALPAAGPAEADADAVVAMLWVRAVDGASRHGPPAFRRDVPYVGSNVRGRLDVRSTVRLRAKGDSTAASVYRARELDNPVTRIIVAADRVLARRVGAFRWRTDRVEDVLAQLHTAVGRRSAAPGDGELQRMRYTPITRPFRWAAGLSARVVRQDPIATPAPPGRLQGLVVDLDDVHAGAILGWARDGRPDLRVETVEAGQILLHDGAMLRGTIELLPEGRDGAPVLLVASVGAAPRRVELVADPPRAAAVVRAAIAEL